VTQENVKVLIVDDDTETSRIVKEMIQACDDIVVLGGPAQSNVYELHNFHEFYVKPKLKDPVKHGAYRQFIKRDKRKNIKANKL
jgi:hypothetical protein